MPNIVVELKFLIDGNSLVHFAAFKSAEQVMRILIERSFDLNSLNEFGMLPIHYCSIDQDLSVLKLLVNAGISTTTQDKYGKTLWHIAAQEDSFNIMETLLQLDDQKETALQQSFC